MKRKLLKLLNEFICTLSIFSAIFVVFLHTYGTLNTGITIVLFVLLTATTLYSASIERRYE